MRKIIRESFPNNMSVDWIIWFGYITDAIIYAPLSPPVKFYSLSKEDYQALRLLLS